MWARTFGNSGSSQIRMVGTPNTPIYTPESPIQYPYNILNPYGEILRLQHLLNVNERRAMDSERYYLDKCKDLEDKLRCNGNGRSGDGWGPKFKVVDPSVSQYKKKLTKAEVDIDLLNTEIRKLKKELNQPPPPPKQWIETVNQRNVEIAELKQEIEKWKSRAVGSGSDSEMISKLQKAIKESDDQIKNLEKRTGMKLRDIAFCVNENQKLKKSCAEKVFLLEKESERMSRQLKDQTSTFERLLNDKDQDLEIIVEAKNKEIKLLKRSLQVQPKGIASGNNSDLELSSEKIAQLEKDLRHKQRKIDKLNTIAEDMNSKYSLQNNQIYNLKSQNKFLEQKLEKLDVKFQTIHEILGAETYAEKKLGKLEKQFKLSQRALKEEFIVSVDDDDLSSDDEGPSEPMDAEDGELLEI